MDLDLIQGLLALMILVNGYLVVQCLLNRSKMELFDNRISTLEEFQHSYVLKCIEELRSHCDEACSGCEECDD